MEPLPGCSLIGRAPGTAPAVVLLHSSMSTRGQWKKLAVELGRDHSVLSLDLAGYGEAPMPACPGEFSIAHEAGRVIASADHFFPGAAILLAGHSYGGAVALQVAKDHPARVAGVVVYEPVCFNLLDDPADRDTIRRIAAEVGTLVAGGRPLDAARRFLDFWNGDGAFESMPEAAQRRFAAAVPKVPLDFQALRSAPPSPLDYARIEAPAMFLGGTLSPSVTRRIVERLGAALPGAAVGWIDDGHMAPAASPERVNPLFARFLRSVGHGRARLAA